ncbi:adenylate kinase family protein [Blattabacterium cuenoti]|uniref:adenylate kinase family protein n=1 Tax=Blattabacterium cuenoti TaxID=1653831 RepID=UPI00163BA3D3|nr:nucleoside monophosphate kinase [Blattabacterium cuenoti]
MIHIILFGPPGCGKGTQSKIIEKKFGFFHLSTGMIFRDHIKRKTSLGKLVNFYINKGKLVPDQITTKILVDKVKELFQYKGIIYDGYPRTKNQILSLKKILNRFSLGKINLIFYFNLQKDLIIKRLLQRGKTSNRNDDININTVNRRIEEYNKETSLIWKNSLLKNNNIIMLNASLSIKKISVFIEKKIYDLMKN